MAGSPLISVINNRVSKESRSDCSEGFFFIIPSQMTQHSNFPVTAARDSAARGKGTTVHNASRLAVLHKTAAGTRAAGIVSSAVTLRVALWI